MYGEFKRLRENMAEAEKKKPSVEYNWLSENCGLKVSNICLGTMTFGTGWKVRIILKGIFKEFMG